MEHYIVTGKVGAGKSSFFAALTAELAKTGGTVTISDEVDTEGVAFFTQEPWIQHLTVRENIIFGREYNQQRYDDVIHACALEEDMELFPAGDLTEVGEKGINLSGGQKVSFGFFYTNFYIRY